jgi:sporulation protein YlmC with PRC-barrel domain
MGHDVHGPDDKVVGQVSDLVLAEDGSGAALIDVGSFLGIGSKEVAIPFAQIEVSQEPMQGEEPRLMIAMTADELQQLPEYVPPAEQTASAESGMTTPAAPDSGLGGDQLAAGTDTGAPAGEMAGAPAMQFTAADFSAERLMGTPVQAMDNSSIGEVRDIIFNADGDIQAVVIDVGGFLGVGEKPVAVSFDSISVQQQGDQVALVVNATQDQLQNAPTFEPAAPVNGQTIQ